MVKRETFAVRGMHCRSCNIFIKHELEKEKSVLKVKPDYQLGQVQVTYDGVLSVEAVNRRIGKYGYQIASHGPSAPSSSGFNPLAIGAILVAVLFLIPLFKYLNLIGGRLIGGAASVSLITAFLIGLVASFSTCMATTGVFFLSFNEELTNNRPSASPSRFAGLFALGRVLAYGLFGGLIGLAGKSFLVSPKVSGILTVAVSLMVIAIALSLVSERLRLWRLQSQKLVGGLIKLAEKHPLTAPFALGAATFFMPCGFTQSLQLYALQAGGFSQGALILGLFAVGTLPSIFGVSVASGLGQRSFGQHFSLASGALILAFALFNIGNGLALTGVNLPFFGSSSPTVLGQSVGNTAQTIDMIVDGAGYSPRSFTVKKGVPVTWKIQGVNVLGCQSFLVVPELNLSQQIRLGENVVEFTPHKEGQILFSCGMGMFRGVINVI